LNYGEAAHQEMMVVVVHGLHTNQHLVIMLKNKKIQQQVANTEFVQVDQQRVPTKLVM
jgi:hypothetical protein